MTILPLYAAPQYAPQVTDWLWQAFGGETLPRQFFASIVQHSQTAEALPLTFIAVEGEQLLGTIGLWRCDLISPPGSVSTAGGAVRRARRPRSGAGRKTAAACDRLCRRAGFRELYLYSACRDFYERFGWRYIGEGLDYPATAVHLYRYDLSPSCGATTE